MKLTFYLFLPSVTQFAHALKPDKLNGDASFQRVALRSVGFEGEAYIQRGQDRPPPWLEFIGPYCDIPNVDQIVNRANSFVLLLRANSRIFAVTTGFGFTAINRENLEPDFGLKVTLNAVAKNRLRSIQSRNVDTTTLHKHIVANKDCAVNVFDVDFYQELLARLEGAPENDKLARKLEGSDSCSLVSDTVFPALPRKCEQLLSYYGKKTYRKHFPFIDNVKMVRDDSLINDLNAKLARAVSERKEGDISLAIPDISVAGVIQEYQVHYPHCNHQSMPDLDVAAVFRYLDSSGLTAPDVGKLAISGVNEDHTCVTGSLPFFRCAVYQTKHNRRVYILTLGRWYEVQPDYVCAVEDRLAERSRSLVIGDRAFLPVMWETETEGEYNERVASTSDFRLMDKNCPTISGTSKIEVCDLFSRQRDFIHVKRKTASATLSHLFSQGSVSATLFCDHEPYRQFTARQLAAPPFSGLVDPSRANCAKYRIVYAIATGEGTRLPQKLPFFSKVTLLYHLRLIERMGFRTGLYHIPVRPRP